MQYETPHRSNMQPSLSELQTGGALESLLSRLSQIEAVIFDMDGTILDSEVVYCRAFQSACSAQGFELKKEMYEKECAGKTNPDCERFMAAAFGSGFDVERFRCDWPRAWEEIATCEGIPLKPGMLDLLAVLDSLGLKRAVGTSADRREMLMSLSPHQLENRFGTIVTGQDVCHGKPAPDIFLTAAAKLNVSPDKCLVIEDSEAGVIAASRAGMSVFVVPDMRAPSAEVESLALLCCSSLQDVCQLFKLLQQSRTE
jgi:beta-phosphoglucomutase-like phosphatase (HAD superfamily)